MIRNLTKEILILWAHDKNIKKDVLHNAKLGARDEERAQNEIRLEK